jgi:predicted nucleic acid-binding protein
VIARTGTLALIIDDWRPGVFTMIVSLSVILELRRTLQKPCFAERRTSAQRDRFLIVLERQTQTTTLIVEVNGVATHPGDDLIVSNAVSAGADYLVTGDRKP